MTSISKIFGETDVSTFVGVPAASLEAPSPGIGILGVPLATPYESTGDYAAASPKAIREAMALYAAATGHYDFDLGGRLFASSDPAGGDTAVYDYGDVPFSPHDFAANRATIRDAIKRLRNADAVPVVIGGDDSIPIPVIDGFDDCQSLHILQFDAHIDWRNELQGETHGLSSNMRRASEMPHVTGITQVGARGIGSARPADAADSLAWGARLFPMTALDESGFDPVIASLPEGGDLFINLDVDALDPSEMPAVIGPAPGGLTYRQIITLLARASARCRIVGFSMAEFYPALDTNGLAARTAGRLICNAIGRIARQQS